MEHLNVAGILVFKAQTLVLSILLSKMSYKVTFPGGLNNLKLMPDRS